MKKELLMLVLFLIGSCGLGTAADKVVVIPLGGANNYMYWQGTWSDTTNYKIGDGVQYEGSSYVCVGAHNSIGSNSPPSAYWDLLAAKGDAGSVFVKQSCTDGGYVIGIDEAGNIICPDSWKYVFVTSAKYDGDLGGDLGADAKCQTEANAASLQGRYKAWVSITNFEPYYEYSRSNNEYRLPSGKVVADNWYDLLSLPLNNPIDEYATGQLVTGYLSVWTGTGPTGKGVVNGTCINWGSSRNTYTGTIGITSRTDSWWTNYDGGTILHCDSEYHLYCFRNFHI